MGTFPLNILSEMVNRPKGKYWNHSKFECCRCKNSSACTECERALLPGMKNALLMLAACRSEYKGSSISASPYNSCMFDKLHIHFSTLKNQHQSRHTRCHSLQKEITHVLKVVAVGLSESWHIFTKLYVFLSQKRVSSASYDFVFFTTKS
jgi:hypothetical protein